MPRLHTIDAEMLETHGNIFNNTDMVRKYTNTKSPNEPYLC